MMRKLVATLVLILQGVFFLNAESFPQFRDRLMAQEGWENAVQMIKDYLAKTDKVEEMRDLQDIWLDVNPEECAAWFEEVRNKNSDSPAYEYLCLRLEEDEELQMQGAYNLCKKHPDFYWGYRLLLLDLMSVILEDEFEENNPLADKGYLLELIDNGQKRFPQDDYFKIFQFHRYRITKNDNKAEQALMGIKDKTLLQANWEKIMYTLVSAKNKALYVKVMPGLISNAVKSGELSPADSLLRFSGGYMSILEETGDWQAILDYLTKNPKLLENYTYCSAWVDALAGQKKWKQLSHDLLKFAREKRFDEKWLDDKLQQWYTELQGFPEWPQLLELSGNPESQQSPLD
jgi:hypothetical protein